MFTPTIRALIPNTITTNSITVTYTASTSFPSGSSVATPNFATVTAINANTPNGANFIT
ncbi:Uncharacterised protein [Streptococcus pneumoniae]|nr:Uncharacterised protein [Streptococcus pneumoniae]